MPPTFSGNAAASLPSMQSSEVEVTRGAVRGGESNSLTSESRAGIRKQVDKQSLDYILRSGLAGGLAGCAVRNMFRQDPAVLIVPPS